MKVVLLTLIALAEPFIHPNSKEQISRSLNKNFSLSHLNHSSSAQFGYCESGWTYFNETDACYKNFFSATFHEAESVCRDSKGHLTSIHSYAENMFVADLAKMGIIMVTEAQGTWIGLVRSDYLYSDWKEDWMWTDGTEVNFKAWAPAEPNNLGGDQRCVVMLPDVFEGSYDLWYEKWSDLSCAVRSRSFVCKKMALH